MIELRNISKSFHDKMLFNKINLIVQPSESFVIVGPSGEGKSVLLKTICGLVPPDEGEVIIEGVNIYQVSHKERSRALRKLGMLFQNNALFDSFTVDQNLYFPMKELNLYTHEERVQKIDQYLKFVGLEGNGKLMPNSLSGGMQKRLGIARGLIVNPEIILYDDPTAGLDPITSKKIIKLIVDLKHQFKSTVVTITNDINRAYQLADRVALLHHGELIIAGNVDETKNSKDPRVKQFTKGEIKGPLTLDYA